MGKRLFALLLALCMVIGLLPLSVFAAGNAFQVDTTTATEGDTFTVKFTQPKTLIVSALSLYINFDNTAFEIIAIDNAPHANIQPNMAGSNDRGMLAIAYTDPQNDAYTTVEEGTVLLSATFKVKDSATPGDKTIEVSHYNIGGKFDDSTYMPEDITPTDAEIGSKTKTVTVVAAPTVINSVTVPIAVPVKGAEPQYPADTEQYTVSMAWNPSDLSFAANKAYKANVTLMAKTGYTFADNATVNVPGATLSYLHVYDGGTGLSFTADFPKTADKTLTGITVTEPDNKNYVHGDELNTDGLVVKAQYDDGPEETITTGYTIDYSPDGYYLKRGETSVSISYGGKTATVTGLTVNPKQLTIDLDAEDRVYDGTKDVTLTGGNLSGVISGETVTAVISTTTGTMADANAGNDKAVSFGTLTLSGADAGNYTLTQPTVTVNISKADPTIDYFDYIKGAIKFYNGNAQEFNTPVLKSPYTGAGTVTVKYNGSETAPTDAGSYKITFDVAEGTNFNAASNIDTYGYMNISKRSVTISGVGADNKPYDGKTDATPNGTATIVGVLDVDRDKVSVKAGSAAFADQYAGTGKTVTFSDYSLEGEGAGNYWLAEQPASVTADITPANQNPTITTTATLAKGGNELDLASLVSGAQDTPTFSIESGSGYATLSGTTLTSGDTTGEVVINVRIPEKDLGGDTTPEYKEYTGKEPITVTIVDKDDAGVTITGDNEKTYGDATFTLNAAATNQGTGTGTWTWDSSNKDVAEVDNNGNVTIKGAGEANITAKYESNTTAGQATITLTVIKKTITEDDFTALPTETKVYNASEQTQAVASATLKKDVDYEIKYENNINAGTARYTVTGKGNYTGTIEKTFVIEQLDASDFMVIIEPNTKEYNGKPWTFVADIAHNENEISVAVAKYESSTPLTEGSDYTLSWSDSTDVGTVTVTATMKGNYTGSATGTFSIEPAKVTITGLSAQNKTYDGNNTATVTGKATINGAIDGDKVSVKPGSAAFADQYAGTGKTVTFSDYEVDGEDAGNYYLTEQPASVTADITPAEQMPNITATATLAKGGNTLNLATLVSGAQGVASFSIASGGEYATLSGTTLTSGNSTGSVVINVSITKKDLGGDSTPEYSEYTSKEPITVTIVDKEDAGVTVTGEDEKTYGDATFTLNAAATNQGTGTGTWTWDSSNKDVAEVDNNGNVTIKGAGEANITAKYESNTTAGQATITLTVKQKTITEDDFTLPTETKVYNASAQTQEVASSTLMADTDYEINYDNNINAGTASYTITGKGNYTGTINKSFTISKADPTVSGVSVKSPTTVYDSNTITDITLGCTAIPSGGSIKLDDGQTLTVGTKDYNWTFAPAPADAANYNTVTGTVRITVVKNELTEIKITTPPAKTAYKYGESFDKTDMEVTATFKNGDVTTSKDFTFTPDGKLGMSDTTITVKYVHDGVEKTATQTITVAKADAPAFVNENFSMKYSSDGNTYDLGLAAEPDDVQNASYTQGTVTTTGSGSADAAINDGKLTVNISGFTAEDVGKTITIPVTFKSDNYEDATFNAVITLTYKDVPTVSANDITVTYTGNPVADSQIQGTAKVGNISVPGSWAFKTGETLTDVAHSGKKTVEFTPENPVDYATVETTLKLTINKANPKVTNVTVTAPDTVYANTPIGDIKLGFTANPTGGSIRLNDNQSLSIGTKDYNWTYTPADPANYNNVTGKVRITVLAAPTKPTISTTSLPNGTVNSSYNRTLEANGTKPIEWQVTEGKLPTGLTLGTDGKITGTPSATGTFTFTVEAKNTEGAVTKEFTVTISAGGGGGSSGGGGGGSSTAIRYTLTYKTNGGNSITATKHDKNAVVNLTATPTREGYDFTGWYAEAALTNKITSIKMDGNRTVYAGWKETEVKPVPTPVNETPLLVVAIDKTTYQLNGKTMTMDSAPFINENDRTMLPVRVIANALGISNDNIKWDNKTKTASFTRADGKVVSCTVNSNVIKIGDEEVTIDTVPVIRNDRIYLPTRALFNAFNVPNENILWDAAARTVTVTKKD